MKGKYPEAIEYFDKTLIYDPEKFEAWFEKGKNLKELGKHQEALKCYDKALAIDPNYEDALKAKKELLEK